MSAYHGFITISSIMREKKRATFSSQVAAQYSIDAMSGD